MKIYLAGPCDTEHRTIMVKIAERLRREPNLDVYCHWELKIENAWGMSQEDWAREVFEADVEAIQRCDSFLFISEGRISSAGSNWEQGMAYAIGKPVYVVQITDNPTSLMTFCGATYFYNSTPYKVKEKITWLARVLAKDEEPIVYQECRTVLT